MASLMRGQYARFFSRKRESFARMMDWSHLQRSRDLENEVSRSTSAAPLKSVGSLQAALEPIHSEDTLLSQSASSIRNTSFLTVQQLLRTGSDALKPPTLRSVSTVSPFSGQVESNKLHHRTITTSPPSFASGQSANDAETSESESSSWFGRMKGMLGLGKKQEEKEGEFTLTKFESQVKQARRFAGIGQLVGQAKSVEARAMIRLFENSEKILGAMNAEEKEDLNKFSEGRKSAVASSVGLTTKDVEDMLTQYNMAKVTFDRLAQWKREGKPMPKTIEEMQQFTAAGMSASPQQPRSTKARQPPPKPVAQSSAKPAARAPRNAMCPCGSKKKYKRCCGKGDSA